MGTGNSQNNGNDLLWVDILISFDIVGEEGWEHPEAEDAAAL
jgi:hypothetical protein